VRRAARRLFTVAASCAVALAAVSAQAAGASAHDDRLCGPLCMAFCAEWLGVEANVQHLAKLVGAARGEGSSLAALQRAGEELGLEARPYAMRLGHLKRLTGRTPGIAHVDGNHFVVAWWDRGRVLVADPPRGIERVTPTDFGRRWNGAILVVSRPGETPSWRPWWLWGAMAAGTLVLAWLGGSTLARVRRRT
jgi:ABC-type bacteriocin/lantibiotic exporter with double-glycine peptidase domain